MLGVVDEEEEDVRDRVVRQRKGLQWGHVLFIGIFLLGAFCLRFVFLSSEMHLTEHRTAVVCGAVIFTILLLLTLLLLVVVMKTNPGYIFSNVATGTAHRCPKCDVVVEEFDHHCGLVGVCIGKGNMKYFVTFLFSGFLTSFVGALGGLEYFYCLGLWLSSSAHWNCSWTSTEKGIRTCNLLDYGRVYSTLIWNKVVWDFKRMVGVLAALGIIYTTLFCLGMTFIYVYKIVSGTYSVQRRRHKMRSFWRHVFRDFFHPKFHLDNEQILISLL